MNIRCSFWGALLVWVPSLRYANGQCARFTFPDLDSDVVTAAENTNISLKFAVRELTPGCLSNSGSFRVEVRKIQSLCNINYFNGTFSPQQRQCTATSEWGVFHFTYTVNRADDKQQFRWLTSIASVASEKIITFNITYPANITTFTLGGDVRTNVKEVMVSQRQPLSVKCAWHHGNPRSAGIIYRYRNNENKRELRRKEDTETSLSHTISSTQCDDSGIYSCEVGDVSVNKTLLVQCAPTELTPLTEFRFEEGKNAELRFSVQSYTRTMTFCRLEAVSSSMPSSARNEDCNSSLTVTGSPPDMTVRVRLDSVRKEDEGTWKLTLTNDVGTGQTEFVLAVTELTTTTISTTTESTSPTSTATSGPMAGDETNPWVVFTAGGVGLALAVITVIVVVIIVCRKRKGKASTEAKVARTGRSANERAESQQPEMITKNLYGGSDDCTMMVNKVSQGSGDTAMTSESTYDEVGSGRQEPKPSTSKQGVIVGNSDYAEVDQPVKKDKKKPKNSPGNSDYAEVDQPVKKDKKKPKNSPGHSDYAEVDRPVKKDEKKPKNSPGEAENATGDMYVDAADIRKNKGKGKQLKSRADNGGDALGDMYVDADEVRAKKKEKKGHGGSDSQETAGADDGRHQNADGLTYVALDFADRPATRHAAPPAAEETEYADISPNGPPPRPRR